MSSPVIFRSFFLLLFLLLLLLLFLHRLSYLVSEFQSELWNTNENVFNHLSFLLSIFIPMYPSIVLNLMAFSMVWFSFLLCMIPTDKQKNCKSNSACHHEVAIKPLCVEIYFCTLAKWLKYDDENRWNHPFPNAIRAGNKRQQNEEWTNKNGKDEEKRNQIKTGKENHTNCFSWRS